MKLDSNWHEGTGVPFWRCFLCGKVVSPWDIDKGGCQHCGSSKISPTNLSLLEGIVQIIRRPSLLKFWRHE